MISKSAFFIFLNVGIAALIYTATGPGITVSRKEQQLMKKVSVLQQNHAPEVKITSPAARSAARWNTQAAYTISVADKEDGESKFEEISENEVFLEVRYVKDSAGIMASARKPAKKDPLGLSVIKTSNCLHCHAFNAKLIGPSFFEISKKYTATAAAPTIELLAKRIREGSSGVWGNVVMPTHTELTPEQTRESVKWILKNGAQTNVSYYTGTEGSIRIRPSATPKEKGFVVLTASYTDHGLKDKPNTSLKGQDISLLQIK